MTQGPCGWLGPSPYDWFVHNILTGGCMRNFSLAARGETLILCAVLFGSTMLGSAAGGAPLLQYGLQAKQSPTGLTVTNATHGPIYANLTLGQPPTSLPKDCDNLGTLIISVTDPELRFTSKRKTITFVGPKGDATKGAYLMEPGETITYDPTTFTCFGAQTCAPGVAGNFFFSQENGTTRGNNGCGGAGTEFPNATTLAEYAINLSANGASGARCADADTTDISAINGINATITIHTSEVGWPIPNATNGFFGTNSYLPGVFGWAATNCNNDSGYPNPSPSCKAPVNAPRPNEAGKCPQPNAEITGPDGTKYCAEINPNNNCNNQRTAFTTGGTVEIVFKGLFDSIFEK